MLLLKNMESSQFQPQQEPNSSSVSPESSANTNLQKLLVILLFLIFLTMLGAVAAYLYVNTQGKQVAVPKATEISDTTELQEQTAKPSVQPNYIFPEPYASLPTTFRVKRAAFTSTDSNVYFLADNSQPNSGMMDPTEYYLLSFPFDNIADQKGTKIAVPFSPKEYPSLSSFQVKNRVFVFGRKDLRQSEEAFPNYSQQLDMAFADSNESGDLSNWQTMSVPMPPDVPVTNGGYYLKTDGTQIYMLVVEDALQYRVYRLNEQDGKYTDWTLAGNILQQIFDGVSGLSSTTHFLEDRVVLVNSETVQTFPFVGRSIGEEGSDIPVELPPLNADYKTKSPYMTVRDNNLYFVTALAKEDGAYIALYKASLDQNPIRFDKVSEKATGISNDQLTEIMYAENSDTIFAVGHDLGQYNQVQSRKLFAFPLAND